MPKSLIKLQTSLSKEPWGRSLVAFLRLTPILTKLLLPLMKSNASARPSPIFSSRTKHCPSGIASNLSLTRRRKFKAGSFWTSPPLPRACPRDPSSPSGSVDEQAVRPGSPSAWCQRLGSRGTAHRPAGRPLALSPAHPTALSPGCPQPCPQAPRCPGRAAPCVTTGCHLRPPPPHSFLLRPEDAETESFRRNQFSSITFIKTGSCAL